MYTVLVTTYRCLIFPKFDMINNYDTFTCNFLAENFIYVNNTYQIHSVIVTYHLMFDFLRGDKWGRETIK
ncbi:hypothetical protein KUTeg_007236 [Tegillarca granosa]|uniref:Uncharacterized protein n=1 Tax=Tegillarca granosa TaxID=220873 RepID=A0ABQ9FFW8_TEGGR|nr:hypothetical protein KUTeg_007236 [Tegillarca granosa]